MLHKAAGRSKHTFLFMVCQDVDGDVETYFPFNCNCGRASKGVGDHLPSLQALDYILTEFSPSGPQHNSKCYCF